MQHVTCRQKIIPDNFESDVKDAEIEWISSYFLTFRDRDEKDAYHKKGKL